MFPSSSPSILILMFLQGAPVMRPSTTAACEDLQRIELALAPAAATREVCISPGLMTGFLFDTPVELELQDEVRFVEVLRGRNGIGFVPPRDIALGERLRLTARIGTGASQELVTFTLVARLGQATHQVEVYSSHRPRESFQYEVVQQQAKVQRLRQRLEHIQAHLELSGGLVGLIAKKLVSGNGVKARELAKQNVLLGEEGPLSFEGGVTYRTDKSVAAEVWLENASSEPWMVAEATLVGADGKKTKEIKLWQEMPIPPDQDDAVIMEFHATNWDTHKNSTLILQDEGSRSIAIPAVTFP
ncbi:DUF2381 family protein [Archangium sp.]|uniref:DUF2381 family protein n=1 Tax=Archangium sp. TaxID=1872627 RepID=UPI002D30FF3A|nr:DUF2381 family protein [Archangium sp.]HYO59656.1 DUF2381 family protein [Archangium sp.]